MLLHVTLCSDQVAIRIQLGYTSAFICMTIGGTLPCHDSNPSRLLHLTTCPVRRVHASISSMLTITNNLCLGETTSQQRIAVIFILNETWALNQRNVLFWNTSGFNLSNSLPLKSIGESKRKRSERYRKISGAK